MKYKIILNKDNLLWEGLIGGTVMFLHVGAIIFAAKNITGTSVSAICFWGLVSLYLVTKACNLLGAFLSRTITIKKSKGGNQ